MTARNEPVNLMVNPDLLGIPQRQDSDRPITYRRVIYPDGRETLQGGYPWVQGVQGGIDWRDMPVVPVDAEGRAIGMEMGHG
jgi:hypothetical protein